MKRNACMWRILIIRFLLMSLMVGGALFAAAGTWRWPSAWVYLITVVGLTFAGRVSVMRKNPDLITERAQSLKKENVKGWDRALMPLAAVILPITILVAAGLDVRFGWTAPYEFKWRVAALFAVVLGILVANRAMVVNTFFSGTVRIQDERMHVVISDGPYRWVRHPSYSAAVLANIATPVLLGSLWALIFSGLFVAAIGVRTALEDRTLKSELYGYMEYSRQVRYRLFPGIW
ncbi:MAG: isoprenylcysteine carboxylmethyltransferase family protein [Spirochaetales bacterium]|nr:isoprenylcysteine carboxylmethyltransferase family protein [Spirochaetales bacterium]